MNLLPHQLRPCLRRRVCLVGIGNPRLGDAAVGVRIAEALNSCHKPPLLPADDTHDAEDPTPVLPSADSSAAPASSPPPASPVAARDPSTAILLAATDPQKFLPEIVRGAYDHVVFIEAVDFGGRPGAVTVLRSEEILTRYTLNPPDARCLGALAEQIEANGHTKTWVLGVQPASLRPDRPLSQSVQGTVQALVRLLSRETGLVCPSVPS